MLQFKNFIFLFAFILIYISIVNVEVIYANLCITIKKMKLLIYINEIKKID